MAYFIFGKNLNNVTGTLYRIAENQSDLNNLNINVADYFIKEVTENDFLNVKNGLKNCNGYDSNNNIILEDQINLYKDKKTLQNEVNDYKQFGVTDTGDLPYYNSEQPFVQESRATNPAWMYRSADVNRWEEPWLNPLVGLEKPFHNNIHTRILEKDYYVGNQGIN